MPARTEHAPGTPSWVDLQTSDPAGAKAFYSALFGWDYDDQDVGHDPAGNPAVYSLALKNGKTVARSRRCRWPEFRRTGTPTSRSPTSTRPPRRSQARVERSSWARST